MEITWLGGRGAYLVDGNRRILVDPPSELNPTPPADVIALSDPPEGGPAGVSATAQGTGARRSESAVTERGPFIITGPGEYEVHGIFVVGVQAPGGSGITTAYCITMGEVAVCHVGGLAGPLAEADREAIGAVDVLLLPLEALEASRAVELVNQLEPSLVVPLADGGGNGHLESFLNEMGADEPEAVSVLNVNPLRLPDQPQVKVIRRAGSS